MKKTYTDQDLSALLKSVEEQFTTQLAKAESAPASLAKSEDKDESKKVEQKKEEPKKEEKEEAHAEKFESKGSEEHEEEKEEKHGEAEGKERMASEDHKEKEQSEHEDAPRSEEGHAQDGCDYDEHDMDHMHKMYMSMSKGELKAHHDSCRMALDKCGMAKCGDMQMQKSEKTEPVQISTEIKNPELELLKSENESQKAKIEELKKNTAAVEELLTKLVKKIVPQGKAITSLDVIAKSENSQEKTLDKSEIKSILSKKVAEDKSLTKSDRDAINSYWLGEASINTISHLLK